MSIEIYPEGHNCPHDWEALPARNGRYRCRLCRALGYRGIVAVDSDPASRPDGSWQIRPAKLAKIFAYRCNKIIEKDGARTNCKGDALTRKGNKNRCSAHQESP